MIYRTHFVLYARTYPSVKVFADQCCAAAELDRLVELRLPLLTLLLLIELLLQPLMAFVLLFKAAPLLPSEAVAGALWLLMVLPLLVLLLLEAAFEEKTHLARNALNERYISFWSAFCC